MTSTDPAGWIGSGERKADAMDPGHAARIAATLGGAAYYAAFLATVERLGAYVSAWADDAPLP